MNHLRPDEKASQAQIESSRRRDELVSKGTKTAIGLGLAATGAGLSARILPFLNELIPADLAMKGINKISPHLGTFLKKGMSSGLDIKDGLNFLKENIMKSQEKAPDQRNIIEQYSPELYQFIKDEIQKGRAPLEAGALAQLQDKFKSSIKKMSDDHKSPFSSILESVFGSSQQPVQQQMQQPQQASGQQALMSILQKIQQARGT